jgi:DNA-binding phage protein
MEFDTELFRTKLQEKRGNLSYPKFAEQVGSNKDTLYAIMQKGGTPHLCTLYKLLTHFGWTTNQFEK